MLHLPLQNRPPHLHNHILHLLRLKLQRDLLLILPRYVPIQHLLLLLQLPDLQCILGGVLLKGLDVTLQLLLNVDEVGDGHQVVVHEVLEGFEVAVSLVGGRGAVGDGRLVELLGFWRKELG